MRQNNEDPSDPDPQPCIKVLTVAKGFFCVCLFVLKKNSRVPVKNLVRAVQYAPLVDVPAKIFI